MQKKYLAFLFFFWVLFFSCFINISFVNAVDVCVQTDCPGAAGTYTTSAWPYNGWLAGLYGSGPNGTTSHSLLITYYDRVCGGSWDCSYWVVKLSKWWGGDELYGTYPVWEYDQPMVLNQYGYYNVHYIIPPYIGYSNGVSFPKEPLTLSGCSGCPATITLDDGNCPTTSPNELKVSCSASPSSVDINDTDKEVTFTPSISGGTPGVYKAIYWGGVCEGEFGENCYKTLSGIGTYTATLTVTSGCQTVTASCSAEVTVVSCTTDDNCPPNPNTVTCSGISDQAIEGVSKATIHGACVKDINGNNGKCKDKFQDCSNDSKAVEPLSFSCSTQNSKDVLQSWIWGRCAEGIEGEPIINGGGGGGCYTSSGYDVIKTCDKHDPQGEYKCTGVTLRQKTTENRCDTNKTFWYCIEENEFCCTDYDYWESIDICENSCVKTGRLRCVGNDGYGNEYTCNYCVNGLEKCKVWSFVGAWLPCPTGWTCVQFGARGEMAICLPFGDGGGGDGDGGGGGGWTWNTNAKICQFNRCVVSYMPGFDQCQEDWECTSHKECNIDKKCVLVPGAGNNLNQCSNDTDCTAQHKECIAQRCLFVPGVGDNLCQQDTDCPLTKRRVCNQEDKCILVDGAGIDQCLSNNDCPVPDPIVTQHKECINRKCVFVPGAADDSCTNDIQCIRTRRICLGTTCIQVVGDGKDLCLSNKDCGGLPGVGNPPFIKDNNLKVFEPERYCIVGIPGMGLATFEWVYQDSDGNEQTGFDLQVSFSPFPVPESDDCPLCEVNRTFTDLSNPDGYTNTQTVFVLINNDFLGSDYIIYGKTYYARVRVLDSTGLKSEWVYYDVDKDGELDSFTKARHPFPYPDFYWLPNPAPGQEIQFIDISVCYKNDKTSYSCKAKNPNTEPPSDNQYTWTFGDSASNNNIGNTLHTYTAIGTYSVTLRVCDDIGCCEVIRNVPVGTPGAGGTPLWREISPF